MTERGWGIVRLALGFAQVFSAAFSFTLLVQTGATTLTLAAVTLTGLLTTISVLLFRTRR